MGLANPTQKSLGRHIDVESQGGTHRRLPPLSSCGIEGGVQGPEGDVVELDGDAHPRVLEADHLAPQLFLPGPVVAPL